MLFAHEHRLRFPFVMDTHLPTDIHDHPLDRAGERPGPRKRPVARDRLATAPPNGQPLASKRELARLGPDFALTDLLVVDVESQRAVGDMRWVLSLLGEDGRKGQGPGRYRLAGTDLLLDLAEPVVEVVQLAILHIEAVPAKAAPVVEDHSLGSTRRNLDLGSDRVGAVADIDRL